MSNDPRVDELVEQALAEGLESDATFPMPPELASAVAERLERIRRVEAQVDALFPQPPQRLGVSVAATRTGLPSVPGYRVESVLGRGGMGVVYKAIQLNLNRPVALKMILGGVHASEVEHRRFAREAEAVAVLRHTNIVQIYDFGKVDGHPYYTMEYVAGGTLAEQLIASPPTVRDAAKVVANLALAVQAAHTAGVVHRDLKPSNVLLTEDGVLKISDFGLARRTDGQGGLTLTGAPMGTPSYMSPEQVTGSKAATAPAVDIYALGALLYEMLTGRPPFSASNFLEVERQVLHTTPTPLSRFSSKAPRDLETICMKCLEKEPQRRYATAGDLADDLERFLRHEPIRARPVGPAERWARWVRRNPTPTALLVAALLLTGLMTYQAGRELATAASRRAEKARLTARLESALSLEQQERHSEAHAILGKLGDGGFADLRVQIDGALADLALIEKLDRVGKVRGSACRLLQQANAFDVVADRNYEALFADAGLLNLDDSTTEAARRIKAEPSQRELVAAIDDWAAATNESDRRDWLLAVANEADPNPDGWREQARDASKWLDRDILVQLTEAPLDPQASPQLLCAVASRMDAVGNDPIAFRRRVQQAYPGDILANFSLADALAPLAPAESLRYLQATIAVSPNFAPGYVKAGNTLIEMGRFREAQDHFEAALKLRPNSRYARIGWWASVIMESRSQLLRIGDIVTLSDGASVLPLKAIGWLTPPGTRQLSSELRFFHAAADSIESGAEWWSALPVVDGSVPSTRGK